MRKEREVGDWTRPIRRRSRWSWRSTVTLNDQQPGVCNICNGQVAPDTVNVQNALAIGSEQSRQFSASLSSEFHKTIKKKVKTMELLKKAVVVKGKAIYDIETQFSWLLVVGQHRSIDIADVFQFELSPVPPALIDENGCLRKGDHQVSQCFCHDSMCSKSGAG